MVDAGARRGDRIVSCARTLLAVACALALAGCAGRGTAPPTAAPPGSQPTPTTPATPSDTLPRGTGAVTAPWDTAGRSGATRRAHVYPEGESALGKRLVAALPDPGGLRPAEGAATIDAITAPVPAIPVPAASAGCWEAQLTATSDAARAGRVRAEAAALLGVPVRVASAGGLHRVRAGGCLDTDAALRLVERARAEGWPEAFRSETGR